MSVPILEIKLNSGVYKLLCPNKHMGREIDVENTLDFFSSIKWDGLQPMWRINTNLLNHASTRRAKCPKCGLEFIIAVK
ncbi:MAG: hypothetical protein ABSA11_15675 [Candidatus Bathyarchaeia archaeon]|jgi:hypothetical protein